MSEKVWNINIPVQVDERDRRAIAAFYGDKGMATLRDCRRFIRTNGEAALADCPDPDNPEPEMEYSTFGAYPKAVFNDPDVFDQERRP